MLTVEDIAVRLGVDPRTVRRYAAVWIERQRDPHVPRVTRVRSGGRGRPSYGVEPRSFERWLCPEAA